MKRGHLLVTLIGAALFAWVIAHVGLPTVFKQARAISLALPVLVVLSLCRLLLQTVSWSAALEGKQISVPRGKLIGIRMASQSLGYLTVLGPVLSEPMKIKLLQTPTEPTVAATFLDSGVYWFASTLAAIVGCVCAAFLAFRGTHYLSTVVAIALLAAGLFLIARRKPVLSGAVRVLGARSPSWLIRGEAMERSIRDQRLQQPRLVGRMFWMDSICQLLVAAEVSVVLWSLGLPINAVTVFSIDGITRVMKIASAWVPARLGADEGAAMSAFMAAGLPPAFGLTFALTRRIRDLLWSLAGLAWLLWAARRTEHPEIDTCSILMREGLSCKS